MWVLLLILAVTVTSLHNSSVTVTNSTQGGTQAVCFEESEKRDKYNYRFDGTVPKNPWNWLGYIRGPMCTAFMVSSGEFNIIDGQMFVTSAHCIWGLYRPQDTEATTDLSIRMAYNGLTTRLVRSEYSFHPMFLQNIEEHPNILNHDYDLAGYWDLDRPSVGGFELADPVTDVMNLKIAGFTQRRYHQEHAFRASIVSVKYVRAHMEYATAASWGGCYAVGSPIYRIRANKYEVIAVNQEDTLITNEGGKVRQWQCDEYENTCKDAYPTPLPTPGPPTLPPAVSISGEDAAEDAAEDGAAGAEDGAAGSEESPTETPAPTETPPPTTPSGGEEELVELSNQVLPFTGFPSGRPNWTPTPAPLHESCPKITTCKFFASVIDSKLLRWTDTKNGYIWGDPHFVTFDGREYDIYNACRYLMVKVGDLEVEGKFDNAPRTMLNAIIVTYRRFKFVMGKRKGSYKAFFKPETGPKWTPIVSLPPFPTKFGGVMEIHQQGSRFEISFSNGVRVTWQPIKFQIHVPMLLRGSVEGLLGNYNGDPNDDCKTRGGRNASCMRTTGNEPVARAEAEYQNWVSSWQTGGDKCTDNNWNSDFGGTDKADVYTVAAEDDQPSDEGPKKTLMEPEEAEKQCEILNDSPFNECWESEWRAPFIDACKTDLQYCPGCSVCQSMKIMADICKSVYPDILYWRDFVEACPKPACNASMVYNVRADPCTYNCAEWNKNIGQICDVDPVPMCECEGDKALNDNGDCIPYLECEN